MPTNQNSINLAGNIPGDILIVDDEIPNLELLTQLLSEAGYQVRPANDPQLALENDPQLALESALAQPPSLILLDVRMPEMDGFEVCRLLKQDERTRDIPILFVSALQEVQDRVRGFEAGGVDFISKPIQEKEVLARVRTHLELRNMQLHLEEMVAKRTAEALEREERFRATFEQAAVGIAHVSPEGRFLRINQKFCDIVGYPEDKVLDLTFQDITHPDDLDADLEYVRQVLAREIENYSMDKRYYRKDGSIVWVNLTVSLLFDKEGNPKYFVSVIKAEQKIIDYQQRLKALATQLTIAEEKERHAIAADLHDHVGQSLALARIQLASARQSASESKLADELDGISDTLLKTLEDTQLLMLELSSPAMHESGLSSAISEWLESQIENRHSLKTEVIDNISHNRRKTLNSNIRTILFRNVRELLVNVVKHARANKVSVRLEDRNTSIRIIVEDDGIGFDPRAMIDAGNKMGGFGLFSIEELMADLGGDLKIVSEPGKGCTAILSAPFGVYDSRERS